MQGQVLPLLALDARLADVLRQPGEALLRQVKLAWWRDIFRIDPGGWPEGEPLLALLRDWPGDQEALVDMVDGWEVLLGDQLDELALAQFAAGRAAAWAALANAETKQVERAAKQYVLADLALNLANPEERGLARNAALAEPAASIPRRFRSLAILRGLTRRALEKNAETPLDGPAAALAALRLGLFGR